jgi:kynurenine formamidase
VNLPAVATLGGLLVFVVGGCRHGSAGTTGSGQLGAAATPLAALDDPSRVIDLTYSFDEHTVYWPTATPFRLDVVARGETAGGFWYATNEFRAAEHGGTHLDAPVHFAEHGVASAEVPLARLVGPAVVVDISERARANADTELVVDDVLLWEERHGAMPAGAIVLLRSGWGSRWPDRARYLGSDVRGDASGLHFPGFSRGAAEFLVRERAIDAVGTDTASIDPGRSRDFPAHRIFAAEGVPVLENLAALDRLPARGATVIALPMKIAGGSGGPTRVIAVLPEAVP